MVTVTATALETTKTRITEGRNIVRTNTVHTMIGISPGERSQVQVSLN
jgi:hypothetical protein